MDKDKHKAIAAGVVLAIMIGGPIFIIGVVELLAYQTFGYRGVLFVSALVIWTWIMWRRSKR